MALPAAELAARLHQTFGAVGMGAGWHHLEFMAQAPQVANDVQLLRGALQGARTLPVRTPPCHAARITRHAARSRSIQKQPCNDLTSGFPNCATNARNDEVLLIASLSAVLFQDAKHNQQGLASVDRLGGVW